MVEKFAENDKNCRKIKDKNGTEKAGSHTFMTTDREVLKQSGSWELDCTHWW